MAFRTLPGIETFQLVASEFSSLRCTQIKEIFVVPEVYSIKCSCFSLAGSAFGGVGGNRFMCHFIFSVVVT